MPRLSGYMQMRVLSARTACRPAASNSHDVRWGAHERSLLPVRNVFRHRLRLGLRSDHWECSLVPVSCSKLTMYRPLLSHGHVPVRARKEKEAGRDIQVRKPIDKEAFEV